MQDERKIGGLLFLAVLAFQLTFASGHLYSFDEVVLLETAEALLDRGGSELAPTPEVEQYAVYGRGGGLYSKLGIGGSAILIPFYAIGKAIAIATSAPTTRVFAEFIASFANAFVVAAIAVVFRRTLLALSFNRRTSLVTTFLLSFSTTLAVYGRGLFADPSTAGALLLAFSAFAADRHLLSGSAVAIAAACRLEFALVAGVFPFFTRPGKWPRLLVPVIFMLTVLGLYNYARLGNPLNQGQIGHDKYDTFSTPIPLGLFGLFFSFGKGLLWYSPPIILAVIGAPAFFRRHAKHASLILLVNLPLILLHAHWHSWMGGWSYGPRRLVASLPLLMIPAACSVENMLSTVRGRRIVASLGALGLFAQLGGLTVNFMSYIRSCPSFDATLWTIEYSAMFGQLRYLRETGRIDIWYFQLLGNSFAATAIFASGIAVSVILCSKLWRLSGASSNSIHP